MTLNQFIDKYLGKQVEYHSYSSNAKYQCVDLANQFIVEVLKSEPLIGTNAKDFPEKINKDLFDWIPDTPEAIPQENDIPIWNGRVGGGAGHIAIARAGCTTSVLKSFDQNWSKALYCTLEDHNYKNVRGWLRLKKIDIIDPDMPEYLKGLLKDQLQIDITSPEGDVRGRIGEITDKLKNYDDLQKQVTKLEKENISLEGQVGGLEREFQALSESRDRLTSEVESLKKEIINEQAKTAKRDETIVDLQNQIDELKESIDPDSKVIISKSEYERLQRRKTTDRLTDTELLRAWLGRKWEALKSVFRR